MALEYKELLSLMKTVAKADPMAATSYSYKGENFTYGDINETLRNELNELAGTYSAYRENKNMIFKLIEETLTDILPKKVLAEYGRFAEVKTWGQGEKPYYTHRLGKVRAKQFITKVGAASRYEVFKLGHEKIEIEYNAIGGGAQIGIEEFLDGRADFAELVQIVMDGMDELVYREIAKALIGGIDQLPAANKVATNYFDEVAMDNLIATAAAYGAPTIYCTREFAVQLMPSSTWAGGASGWSDNMKDEYWRNGYFTKYKTTPVIVLPNSFEDETNSKKVIDPGYCWIIPSGGNDKPVKVAFEGNTLVKDHDNDDWSKDMMVYKKVGVGVMMTNNICVYKDTGLAGNLVNPTPAYPTNNN